MPITLGLNISSVKAQNQLSRTTGELSSTFERLSSGQRINKASDDAAGLAVADSLRVDARVYTQGVRNLNDGLSVLNVADGALGELTNITFRLTELAEQAANGTLGVSQRAALDEEAQALSDEYFRIVQSTEFNNRKLFGADYGELRLQAGYGLDASISDGFGGAIGTGDFLAAKASSFGAGNFSRISKTGDFNGDGILDIAGSIVAANDGIDILIGDGNGGFTYSENYAAGTNPRDLDIADFNGDGILDVVTINTGDTTASVFLGQGDGSFGSQIVTSIAGIDNIITGDFNGDGLADIAVRDENFDGSDYSTNIEIRIGSGDGTFGSSTTIYAADNSTDFVVADFDGSGSEDIVLIDSDGARIQFLSGAGDGTFTLEESTTTAGFAQNAVGTGFGDFNNDRILDLTFIDFTDRVYISYGVGDGTFENTTRVADSGNHSVVTATDLNSDGFDDLVTGSSDNDTISFLINDGSGNFNERQSLATGLNPTNLVAEDFNNDGVVDILSNSTSSQNVSVFLADAAEGVSALLDFSLTGIAEAKQALSRFSQKLGQLTEQRGQIGAFQARVRVAENVLQSSIENTKAAESRIRDADIAAESADLVRLQILQQSSTAVLSQANLQPELVLQLLNV